MKFCSKIFFVASLLFSFAVSAHPGGSHLVCHSRAGSDSEQYIRLSVSRSNGLGWMAPQISVAVNGKEYILDTPSEESMYGETSHDSPLKLIHVSVSVAKNEGMNTAQLNVQAIPDSVRAYNSRGHLVHWSLKASQEDCYDSNGKSTFQGIFQGILYSTDGTISFEPQILDCKLVYDPGMAC